MNARRPIAATAMFLALRAVPCIVVAQPIQPTFLKVTPNPSQVVVLPAGGVLVGSRALLPNTGRVEFIGADGDSATFLSGLPYAGLLDYQPGDLNGDAAVDVQDILLAITHLFAGGPPPASTPLEPGGLAARGSTLYIATGEIVPAGQKASPSRGAVLRATFSAGLDVRAPFALGAQDYAALLAGQTVLLSNGAGDTASVSLRVNGFTTISDLAVDETTGRLYITSRADASISWIPLD